MQGLACSQAHHTACAKGSEEPEALKWRNDVLRFMF